MNLMAFSFWCSLVFFVVGVSLITWMHVNKKAEKPALTMAAMATIALALIPLRCFYFSAKIDNFLLCGLVSCMDSIRYFAMGKVFDPSSAWLDNPYYYAYCSMEIALSVIAPLFTATVLASVISLIYDRIRLAWKSSAPVCYFSELNERSLTLAKDLRKNNKGTKKTKLVFCKVAGNNPLRQEAKDQGAILTADPIHILNIPKPISCQVRVFLIDNEEDNNIQTFLKMQKRLCFEPEEKPATHPESDFLVFSTQESAELVYDAILNKLDKDLLAFDLHLINETRQAAQKLLLDHPLYDAAKNSSDSSRISVLVVGCGYLGMQILKTAMICGTMDSYQFDIQVIDDQADRLAHQFFHEYPFLATPSDIFPGDPHDPENKHPAIAPKFYRANVLTDEFDDILKQHCTGCNYIVVATGNDQLNVTTAEFLHRWYTQRVLLGEAQKDCNPLIFAAVRDSERHKGLVPLEQADGYCGQFRLFANNMDIYSVHWLLNRPLDNAAALFNRCYGEKNPAQRTHLMLTSQDSDTRLKNKRKLLELDVMSQRSNQIVALHSLYKLQDLLHWSEIQHREQRDAVYDLEKCAENDSIGSFFRLAGLMEECCNAKPDSEHHIDLIDLEHRRWTLFYALSGWTVYGKDQLTKWLKNGNKEKALLDPEKNHRSKAAKLHGCMIPTKDLAALAEDLPVPAGGTRRSFVENDLTVWQTSLFAWLMLSVSPDTADRLIQMLLPKYERHKEEPDMLKWLRQIQRIVQSEATPTPTK